MHVCDIHISPVASPGELIDAGEKIFCFSLDVRMNGVKIVNGKLLEDLLKGIQPPVIVPWTEPELEPVTIKVQRGVVDEIRLAGILEYALNSPAVSAIKINGKSFK